MDDAGGASHLDDPDFLLHMATNELLPRSEWNVDYLSEAYRRFTMQQEGRHLFEPFIDDIMTALPDQSVQSEMFWQPDIGGLPEEFYSTVAQIAASHIMNPRRAYQDHYMNMLAGLIGKTADRQTSNELWAVFPQRLRESAELSEIDTNRGEGPKCAVQCTNAAQTSICTTTLDNRTVDPRSEARAGTDLRDRKALRSNRRGTKADR
ncbi:hypothetical protein SAMN04488550_0932 [Gordonia malaquae]|uniref:Uncharacterized protein n=1 Tax=Gordonia malaquae NBRC 108250 TaxID=1223542 RepID=M3VCH8_GORML|nr:hypothetical protein [Gordonia malaquae]GAC82038.1 hypothetical protein GM1_061_00080 [Gordonia malaquae NBRC 108250]SEB87029.1 hypothetical protein SAMN04488550_0932 [Gordonia malaquae]